MDRAVSQWLKRTRIPHANQILISKKLKKSYTIYGAMLLFPPTAFTGPEWDAIEAYLDDTIWTELYNSICTHLKITHIALNKPIPLHLDPAPPLSCPRQDEDKEAKAINILRSPISFNPLHGSFGPTSASSPPTLADFSEALWITARQNGIDQVWAPRWTMFSRGNISEKARLLTLPSVLTAVGEGPCAAVDLYAGIGYFAFSYVKAGVDVVCCWDLNGWSVEGLRRGASRNRWAAVDGMGEEESAARLIVFNESNERAPERVLTLRRSGRLPPVRHVNCGMLPSSKEGLERAARVLDEQRDGWVHVHENFLVEEIERKAEETRDEMEAILETVRGARVRVEVEYVNRLKSYAPGVMHCVVDIIVHANPPA